MNKTTEQLIIANIKKAATALKISTTELILIIESFGKGARFVSFDYSSSQSENSELATYVCNINVSYSNALAKDLQSVKDLDVSTVDLTRINFDAIDLKGKSEAEYTASVKSNLVKARAELIESLEKSMNKTPEQITREQQESGILTLTSNGVLKFNLNTLNLLLHAQSVKKHTRIKGSFKVTAKGAKTTAKELIKKAANFSTGKYRNFKWSTENMIQAKFKGLETAPTA